jgi:hypothetical protein
MLSLPYWDIGARKPNYSIPLFDTYLFPRMVRNSPEFCPA